MSRTDRRLVGPIAGLGLLAACAAPLPEVSAPALAPPDPVFSLVALTPLFDRGIGGCGATAGAAAAARCATAGVSTTDRASLFTLAPGPSLRGPPRSFTLAELATFTAQRGLVCQPAMDPRVFACVAETRIELGGEQTARTVPVRAEVDFRRGARPSFTPVRIAMVPREARADSPVEAATCRPCRNGG